MNGGSKKITREREESFHPKIPKGIVQKYGEGDDITKWFTAFERACSMRNIPLKYWGAILWELFLGKCRDRCLTMDDEETKSYDLMTGTLIEGFGLTTEEYRVKFRETHKTSSQSCVDFDDFSVKTVGGWLKGSDVKDYDGLYNLMMKEHLLVNCTSEKLYQYLVDLGPVSPQELGKKADHWVKTRVWVTKRKGS